ncbi:MAG TPA: TIGR02588 family protein [Gammaproteobacteria bacterium]
MAGRGHHAEHHKYAAERRPPLWERIVAGVSVLLVAGLLGHLFHEVATVDPSPPDIVVKIVEIRDNGDDWVVVFDAWNYGGETAAGVSITGELSRWGLVTESAEVTLDFIPAESSRRGGLYFRQDPGGKDLALRATGYVLP